MEQFANIDANFQKLSNFELNSGIPGKSCLYVTINLMAPFVFPTTDINKSEYEDTTDFNCWRDWNDKYIPQFIEELGRENWQKLEDSVVADYEQFNRLTSCSQNEYAVLAAQLLWGSPVTFAMHGPDPGSESLTGALHAKYGAVEGGVKCKNSEGAEKTYYGNWLWQIFKAGEDCETRASIFLDHIKISVPGRIIVAISPTEDTMTYRPVGSLEYWYIDPRFRNSATEREDTNTYDMSCVMHWTPEGNAEGVNWPGHFEILEIFPTIRRGEDGKYYWFINGLNTGIPVQGPAGKDGTPAQLIVVQRIENVLGYDPIKYPNGRLAIGPLPGEFIIPMSAFAGDSPRNIPSRTQLVSDIPSIVPQYIETRDAEGERVWTPWPINLKALDGEENIYNRTTSFKLNITSHDTDPVKDQAWLSELVHEGFISPEPENLFRIYRLVGREILWKGFAESKINDKDDPVNHKFDPSCDEYYFGKNNVSEPDEESSKQQLIELLDGATAIVLPGPAYQYDRTDTSYWITTLRKVEWHRPGTPQNAHTGRYMLIAYCSDEERIHNSIDDHTQAGMMQRLDAFTYKKNGDNRNKPRGLMLPIGSAYAAYQDGNFEWAWASHIIHSDCGGFVKFDSDGKDNRRGKQQINRVQTFASDALQNVTGRAESIVETQYSEVIGKRILHVGSVNDYRALNYVNNDAKSPNGGVPGREELPQSLAGKIGDADFFGSTVDGWFIGSELHVDEPVTITRYRDLHKRQRLLNVEGDVVIGPRRHVNDDAENPYTYCKRDGGLVVHSTISPDTGRDELIFPKNYNPAISIFNKDWFDGLEIKHREFFNDLKDHGAQPWKSQFGRWKYADGKYRALYNVDTRTIGDNSENSDADNKRHRFSFVADDGIGARVFVAQDGIVVYNPDSDIKDGNKQLSTFSVDAQGNIQTTGTEVRSNADDTLWVFHSRWTGPENSYADMQKAGEVINWDWLDTNKGDIKNMIFTKPSHNKLMIGTDHEVQFVDKKHNSIRRLERSWRATNFYPWEGAENTEMCRIPMGWLFNFGPLDDTGYHMRTFMFNRAGTIFGQSWGSNELMPVTAVISPDINHFYGVLHVNGIDCMAIRSKAKENSQKQDQYISGRYGTQINHGLIVGPALGNIGNDTDVPRNLDVQDFENDSLCMKYHSMSWQEDSTDGASTIWGLGDDISMFDGDVNTTIAIWGRGSIFAEKTLIADEDLVVNRAATIRAQIRAKSFRRHNNSSTTGDPYENGYCGWSFLLDNGLSSHNAPRHTIRNGGNEFRNNVMTPIILDMGENLGSKRLIRFGYARNARLNNINDVIVDVVNRDEVPDRDICLFGKFPDGVASVKTRAFAAPGGLVYWGHRHTEASKEIHTYSSGGVPQWLRDAMKNADSDPIDDSTYTYFGTNMDTDRKKHDEDVKGYRFEACLVEAISTPYSVTVNLYIACLGKWEQEGGNRCARGIWGAGFGNDDHKQRLWRNIYTHLYLPEGVAIPVHPVYGNTHGMIAAANINKAGDWREKGFNQDKPQTPGIVWRLDTNGQIIMDTAVQGMAIFGNDDKACIATASFTYPLTRDNKYMGQPDAPSNPSGGDHDDNDNIDDDEDSTNDANTNATFNQITCDAVNTKTWLNTAALNEVKSFIVEMCQSDEDDEGELGKHEVPFGIISANRLPSGKTIISMWVTAYGELGEKDLTHRSINFVATANGDSDFTISEFSTYLLKETFNPGYYKSTQRNGNKPTGSIQYIGTDQNGVVSTDEWPYVWRTNDGKSWTLIDAPYTLDNSFVYLVSTGRSIYIENKGTVNQKEYHFPSGFICAFNSAGNEVFRIGKDYYTDIESNVNIPNGQSKPNFARIINNLASTAAAGKIKNVQGFTYGWKISQTNWNNATSRLVYKNYSVFDLVGGGNKTLSQISEEHATVEPAMRSVYMGYFVNANGAYLPNPITLSWKFDFWRNGNMRQLQAWFGAAFNSMLIGGQWNAHGYDYKRGLYSDAVGWPSSWDGCYIHSYQFILLNMTTEVSAATPDSNIGAGSKSGFAGQFVVHYQNDEFIMDGQIYAIINQLEWSDEPGVPTGTKYLCYGFGLGPGAIYWPTGLDSTMAFKMAIPIVRFASASLILTRISSGKRYQFTYDGTNHSFTEL